MRKKLNTIIVSECNCFMTTSTYSFKMPKGTTKITKKIISDAADENQIVEAELPLSDKATKRVLAPFVRIVRKGQKPREVEEAKHFSFYLQKTSSVLLRDLYSFLSDSADIAALLHETADVLKIVTKAASVTLYLMNPERNEIYQSSKKTVDDRHKIGWKIQEGSTIAAFVAYNKNYVLVDDILEDDRFPEGVGYDSEKIKSVLCVPVVTPDGECFAIIELCRQLFDGPFSKDDLKITLILTGWMGAAIHQNSKRLALQRQQELNDCLLDLTKCYFGESVAIEKLISEIVKFAKVTLNAERGAFFVIDQDSEDLIAELFEEGAEEESQSKKSQKVRFSKGPGIAGLVARTGITVNVKDAYNDARFNKEIDQKTGFITRSILCMPIMGVERILGVIQVVNKKSGGSFTITDETLFQTFSVYSALALSYTKVTKMMQSTKHLNNCFMTMLQLQLKPCVHDTSNYLQNLLVTIPAGFNHFSWYITPENHRQMPQLVLYMMLQVIPHQELNLQNSMQFILSVRKFYRNTPYHNFEHAFNVCHCIYLVIKRNFNKFTHIEIKALMLAALTHDLDHQGFTNNFLELTKDDLSCLYENSFLENHKFNIAMLLLETSNIFTMLNDEEFDELRGEIKNAILATDYFYYFNSKSHLKSLVQQKTFTWSNQVHRSCAKGIIMMAADLSGQCKPFLASKRITDNLYAEFYFQGDLEKEMGLCPLTLMDREYSRNIPEEQVQFLTIVAMPCLDLLHNILPNTEMMLKHAKMVKQTWLDIIGVRGKKCWRQDDSIVEKRYNY